MLRNGRSIRHGMGHYSRNSPWMKSGENTIGLKRMGRGMVAEAADASSRVIKVGEIELFGVSGNGMEFWGSWLWCGCVVVVVVLKTWCITAGCTIRKRYA